MNETQAKALLESPIAPNGIVLPSSSTVATELKRDLRALSEADAVVRQLDRVKEEAARALSAGKLVRKEREALHRLLSTIQGARAQAVEVHARVLARLAGLQASTIGTALRDLEALAGPVEAPRSPAA